MKVINKENRQDGSTLLLVLLISVVMMSTLASYLFLVSNERTLAARSQDWNAAIPVAEAGIEEALTQLAYAGTNNLTTNSWTHGGDGMYHKTRGLTSSSFYGTSIQLAAQPTIWSTGFVASPFYGTNNSVKRLVKVVAVKTSGFGYGILTKSTILIQGGATVDSFNGAAGPYTSATATSNAVVVTDSSATPAITLQPGTIDGTAMTGPGGTVSGSSSVTGGVTTNANVQINDIPIPSWSSNSALYSITIPSAMVGGTNYDFVATNGNYKVDTLNIQGSQKMAINGNATIYLTQTGNNVLVVGGSGFIYITPGSSLTIYSAGAIVISGSGVVNGTQSASQCYIYGLPTCTSATYSGSALFYGVVDVPEAAFSFTGGSGAAGAFVANTVNIQGSTARVHYDTSLNSSGVGYVVQSWNEMKAQ